LNRVVCHVASKKNRSVCSSLQIDLFFAYDICRVGIEM
jgi:hypothetical protein